MQLATIVVEPEQQRSDPLAFAVLVPAEAGDDTVGRPRVLHLDHRPLAWLVDAIVRLDDDAVEAGALESRQPFGGDVAIAGGRRHVDRRHDVGERALEAAAPFTLWFAAQIDAVERERIEGNKRRRRLLRQPGGARGGRMKAELE